MDNRVWAIWDTYTKEMVILSDNTEELSDKTGLAKEVFDSMCVEDAYVIREYKVHCRDNTKSYYTSKDRKESILNKYIELKTLEELITERDEILNRTVGVSYWYQRVLELNKEIEEVQHVRRKTDKN